MKKSKTMIVSIILTIVLAVALVIVCVVLYGQKKQNDEHLATIESQNQTINALQDEGIIELIEYIKSIMGGEVIINDESDPLWPYSYLELSYPEMETVEVEFKVISAKIDGDSAELVFCYSYKYLDAKGETIMLNSASDDRPTTWWLEKQNGEWVIVDKHAFP